jgi:TonB family protein
MDRQGEAVSGNVIALLPEAPTHWSTFAISFLAQTALLVFVAKTSISFMAPVFDPIDTRESVHLVAPDLTPPPQEPVRVAQEKPTPASKPIVPPKIQAKAPPPPPIEVPKPKVEEAKLTPPPVAQVAKIDARKPEVLSGSSAPPTIPKPPRQVQTGGFGDPNGVPANPNAPAGKGPVIAQVGSFDLPQGPGNGNGTGGRKGVPGTVASAGFGNGVAGPGGPGNSSSGGGKVRTTNFGSAEPPIDTPKKQTASAPAKDTPVSLLSKPVPSYTTEARQRKIEGDVELEVEFSATGQVHVLRVVQGLGYGLDEAAVRAAEKIRFAPARRDGQAVDAEGRLKIIFRLS